MFTSHEFDLEMTFDVKSLVKGKTQQTTQPQGKTSYLFNPTSWEAVQVGSNSPPAEAGESTPWVLTVLITPESLFLRALSGVFKNAVQVTS